MYEQLVERYREISALGDAAGVLRWDQEVMMPEGATPARSRQLSTLSSVQHDLLTADETERLLDGAEDESLDGRQRAAVREIRREYERADRVPRDLVEEISRAVSEAHPVWREARENSEFADFEDTLANLVDLKRRYAEAIDPDRPAYEVLFEDYEPCLDLEVVDSVLGSLRSEIPGLVEGAATDVDENPLGTGHPEERQEALAREALDYLGYDWSHGRLDVAPHPFSSGNQYDARVTTRYGDDVLDALTSTVHEFGHALYTLGLPRDEYGSPLGESRDLSVHESQSRFWENHVARSPEFWRGFAPRAEDALDVEVDADTVAAYLNRVKPDNLIRVEADELTYHLHIAVRFDVERRLVEGDLDVSEVPAAWNDAYDDVVGVRPQDDAEGVLQDIHWSHGSFGYFPTYSLGSVLAAQIHEAMDREVDVAARAEDGEFSPLREWLRDEVHRHGRRYETDELVRRATGESLSADAFLSYVGEKYG
ncbi:MAG: carboxypeptidase M32 [Halobacteriales archaeon]